MGLFDLFRRKDAAYYFEHTKRNLTARRWVAARDDARDGLGLRQLSEDQKLELEAALHDANQQICRLNIEDADHCASQGNFLRAIESLETALAHAPTDDIASIVRDKLTQVKEARQAAKNAAEVEIIAPIPDFDDAPSDDGDSDYISDEYRALLSGLVPEVAEIYLQLGPGFAAGYLALNEGEGHMALTQFSDIEPSNDQELGCLAFEQARAFLLIQDTEAALTSLDVAAAIRGSSPIFLSDHPSIAFLRAEAFVLEQEVDEAIKALEQGLRARPDHPVLTPYLAALLVRQKRFDDAEQILSNAKACSRQDPQTWLLRAKVIEERGDMRAASEVLELGMKNCGCSPQSMPHPMMARALADLYLRQEVKPERVETLIDQVFTASRGDQDWSNYLLKARFLKWQGDGELASASIKMALAQLPSDPNDPRRKLVLSEFPS